MKVIKRQQVTEVVTTRQVSHTLKLGNNIYHRYETIKVYVPYMDCSIVKNDSIVKWSIEVGNRTSRDLTKKRLNNLCLRSILLKLI